MQLNTYESGALRDVFVTVPSAEAQMTLAVVDKLAKLRLKLVRHGYTVSDDSRNLPFLEFVSMEIAASGYAVHGYDLAFDDDTWRPPPPRRAAHPPS